MSDSDVSTPSSPVKSTHNSPLKQDFEERCKEVSEPEVACFLLNLTHPGGRPLPLEVMNEENISSLLRELGHVEPISISIISDIQSVIEVSKDIDLFELTTVLNGVVCWRNYQLCMAAMFGGRQTMMKTAMDRTTQQREHDKALEREAELRREVEEQKHEFDRMMSKVALQMAELQALKTSFSQFSVSPTIVPSVAPSVQPIAEAIQATTPASPSVVPHTLRPPKLPTYSGADPVPKGESTFEQWSFQVEANLKNCSAAALKQAIVNSLSGEAAEYLEFLGFDTSPADIIRKFKTRFALTSTSTKLQSDFFQIEQNKGERVQKFAGRLEKLYKKLAIKFPERYNLHLLTERLFFGMSQQLRDNTRYLYDTRRREGQTLEYEELLQAARDAEVEWTETGAKPKPPKVARMATSKDETDNEGSAKVMVEAVQKSSDVLKQQMAGLTDAIQNMNFGARPKDNQVPRSPAKGAAGRGNGRNRLAGVTPTPGTYDPEKLKNIICHRCFGWGHTWRRCPTPADLEPPAGFQGNAKAGEQSRTPAPRADAQGRKPTTSSKE